MIVEKGKKFQVRSASGRKCLGSYSTKLKAEKRQKNVDYFKQTGSWPQPKP